MKNHDEARHKRLQGMVKQLNEGRKKTETVPVAAVLVEEKQEILSPIHVMTRNSSEIAKKKSKKKDSE